MKKNTRRLCTGIAIQTGALVLSEIVMYLIAYVIVLAPLYENEMLKTLLFPPIMYFTGLVAFIVWFTSKAKKFTDQTYVTYAPENYKSGLFFGLTYALQILISVALDFLVYMAVMDAVGPVIGYIAITSIFMLIGDVLAFFLCKPVSD